MAFIGALSLPAQQALNEDYNQWKEALSNNQATAASRVSVPRGFTLELIRSAQAGEGSWVALAFDPQGRLILAREDRGLLRLTFSQKSSVVEKVEIINTNLLECRGLLFAHGALYANANNSKGLFRLRDHDGDGMFEEIKLLRSTPGGVGHGRNQLALGPDGLIYSIHGDDVGLPREGVSPSSPFQHYGEDRLLPSEWDRHLFNADAKMPFGHLVRTDPEGQRWEIVAGGLRNPFGIDFNPAGDLFTFDADMEWDVGLPWYHPTRVLHLVPGGDYGWRRGTGVLPVWSPDTLPSAVDIGVSSPTAIKFGTRSNWPEPWKSALFIQDWSYGKIIAVHLSRFGRSYRGRAEPFVHGRPLNVTGLDFAPDGSMYFTTGGRRTQSGLYRLSWTGGGSSTKNEGRRQSRESAKPESSDLWSRLNNDDRWVRHEARIELERLPLDQWMEKALHHPQPTAGLTALLSLSRVGEKSDQKRLIGRVLFWRSKKLNPDEELLAIRALAVSFIRMGRPEADDAQRVLNGWEPFFPGRDARVNQDLCQLLVFLESANAVSKTVPMLDQPRSQEEKLHYLFTLSRVTNGWTRSHRITYFKWLQRARAEFQGANMLPTALNYIRADALGHLTPDEKESVKEYLETLSPLDSPVVSRPIVKEWSIGDLPQLLKAQGTNPQRGERLFTEIGCAQCHRVGLNGGVIGPDLTSVGARFDRRALLESLLAPSLVVAEVYRPVTVTTRSGAIFDGRILGEDEKSITVATNPVDPDQRRRVARSDIVSVEISKNSPMPEGMLSTLSAGEIADLVSWLQSP